MEKWCGFGPILFSSLSLIMSRLRTCAYTHESYYHLSVQINNDDDDGFGWQARILGPCGTPVTSGGGPKGTLCRCSLIISREDSSVYSWILLSFVGANNTDDDFEFKSLSTDFSRNRKITYPLTLGNYWFCCGLRMN